MIRIHSKKMEFVSKVEEVLRQNSTAAFSLEFKVGELIKKLFERKRSDFRMLVALQHFYNDCVSYVYFAILF